MSIHVVGDLEFRKSLAAIAGQLPYATAIALNKMSGKAMEAQKEAMHRSFDRPTPWAINAPYRTYATKTDLESTTKLKKGKTQDPQDETGYIGVQIFGGDRKDKASEKWLRRAGHLAGNEQIVPGGKIKLNKYGNITGGRMSSILGALGSGSATSAGGKWVVGQVGSGAGAQRGIWKIVGETWQPMVMFVKRARYKPLLPYYAATNAEWEKSWQPIFAEAIDKALASAK